MVNHGILNSDNRKGVSEYDAARNDEWNRGSWIWGWAREVVETLTLRHKEWGHPMKRSRKRVNCGQGIGLVKISASWSWVEMCWIVMVLEIVWERKWCRRTLGEYPRQEDKGAHINLYRTVPFQHGEGVGLWYVRFFVLCCWEVERQGCWHLVVATR